MNDCSEWRRFHLNLSSGKFQETQNSPMIGRILTFKFFSFVKNFNFQLACIFAYASLAITEITV